MVRTSQEPIPTTPQLRRSTSTQPRPRQASSANATPRQGHKTRPVLGERVENFARPVSQLRSLKDSLKNVATSKRQRPMDSPVRPSLTRLVGKSPIATMRPSPSSSSIRSAASKAPRPSVVIPSYGDDSQLLDMTMGGGMDAFETTDESEDEQGASSPGRGKPTGLLTPENSQTLMAQQSSPNRTQTVKKPRKSNATRQRTPVRLPTPPASQATQAEGGNPSLGIASVSRVRARPSPTPPRRISTIPASVLDNTFLQQLPSPNPRQKKKSRSSDGSTGSTGRRVVEVVIPSRRTASQEPRGDSPQTRPQNLSESTKSSGKAAYASLSQSTSRLPSATLSQSTSKRRTSGGSLNSSQSSIKTPAASRKKAIPSTAPARRRQSKAPVTGSVKEAAKRRASTGTALSKSTLGKNRSRRRKTLTPELAQALSGILAEPIHGSPGDDPLLLKPEPRKTKKWNGRASGSGNSGGHGLGLELEDVHESPVRQRTPRQIIAPITPRPTTVVESPREPSPEAELEPPQVDGYVYNEYGDVDFGQDDPYFDDAGGWSDDGSVAEDDTFLHVKERNSRGEQEEERAEEEDKEVPASPFVLRRVSAEPVPEKKNVEAREPSPTQLGHRDVTEQEEHLDSTMEQHKEQAAQPGDVTVDDGDITLEAAQGEWDEENSGETAVRVTPEHSPELPDLQQLQGMSMSPMGEAPEWLVAPSSRASSLALPTSEAGPPIRDRVASATPGPISRRQTPSHTPAGSPRRPSSSPAPTPTQRQYIPHLPRTPSIPPPVHAHDFATDMAIGQPSMPSFALTGTSQQTARTLSQSPSASVLQRSFHALNFTNDDLAQLRASPKMMSSPAMSVASERTARMASRSPLPLPSPSGSQSSIRAPITPLARMAIETKTEVEDVCQSQKPLIVSNRSQYLSSMSPGPLSRSPFSLIKYRGEVQSSPMVPFSFAREPSEAPTDLSDTEPAEEDCKNDIVEQAERMVARLSMPLSPRFDLATMQERAPSLVIQEASSPRGTPVKDLEKVGDGVSPTSPAGTALETLSPRRRTLSPSPARGSIPVEDMSVMSVKPATPDLNLLSPSKTLRSPLDGQTPLRVGTPAREPTPDQETSPLRKPTHVLGSTSARVTTPIGERMPERERSPTPSSTLCANGNGMPQSPTSPAQQRSTTPHSPTPVRAKTPDISERTPISVDMPIPRPMPRCSNGTPHPSASFNMSGLHLDLSPTVKGSLPIEQPMLRSEGSPQRALSSPELEVHSTRSSPRRSPRLSSRAPADPLSSASPLRPANPMLLGEELRAVSRDLADHEAEVVLEELAAPTQEFDIDEPQSRLPTNEQSGQIEIAFGGEERDSGESTREDTVNNGDIPADEEMAGDESVMSTMTDKTAEGEAGAWDDSMSFDDQSLAYTGENQVACGEEGDDEDNTSDEEPKQDIVKAQEEGAESVTEEANPSHEEIDEPDSAGQETEEKIVISVINRGVVKIEPEDEERAINESSVQQATAIPPVPSASLKEQVEQSTPLTPTRQQRTEPITTTPEGSPGPARLWQAAATGTVAKGSENLASQGPAKQPQQVAGPSTPVTSFSQQAAIGSPSSPLYPSLENLASPLAAGMSFVTSTPAQHQVSNLTMSLNTPVQSPALRVAAKNNSREGVLALENEFARRQVGHSKLSQQMLPSSSPSRTDTDDTTEAALAKKTTIEEEDPSHASETECDSSAELQAPSGGKGKEVDRSIRIKKPRESLYDELAAAAAAKGDEDADDSLNSIVEISSKDPQAAARAAALLKMNHKYIEYGILNSAIEQAKESSFTSNHSHRVDKRDLLYEAELELVSQRRSRSLSTSRAPSLAREWEEARGVREMSVMSFRTDDFPVPGGFVKTPLKRPRSPLPPSSLARHRSNPTHLHAPATVKRSKSKSSKAWGVQDWKRLEKAFKASKEEWVKERGVKALPGGLISWARRSTFGQSSVASEAKPWDAELFVAKFLEGEGEKANREEWNSEEILLRVHALESRAERSKSGNISTSSLMDFQTPVKKPRVDRNPSVSVEVSSVETPAPIARPQDAVPSTLKKMFGYVWGRGGSTTEPIQEKGGGLMKDFEAAKEKVKENPPMKEIATREAPVVPTISASRTVPPSIFVPRPTPSPALATSAFSSIPNTSYNSNASYNSDFASASYSSFQGNSSGRLFPPLEPSLTQRTSAIAKLFPDGASHIRPPPKGNQPIKLPSAAFGVKRSGSVKDMARALEESFEKQT
ncbi:hypothetical protein IAR50_005492 [Cryptococcus sp. DSM 104548]